MIIHWRKMITSVNAPCIGKSVAIRTFASIAQPTIWLSLREQAFRDQKPTPGRWSERDFAREFATKWWWRPEWQWFAEMSDAAGSKYVGTVTLAARGTPERFVPVVHWLAVLPEFRRHGIAQALLATLEHTAYQAGFRELQVETHSNWTAAARFYESAGYHRLKPPSSEPERVDPPR